MNLLSGLFSINIIPQRSFVKYKPCFDSKAFFSVILPGFTFPCDRHIFCICLYNRNFFTQYDIKKKNLRKIFIRFAFHILQVYIERNSLWKLPCIRQKLLFYRN